MPEQDAKRLAALHRYDILDTPAQPVFDELARLAAQVCGAPFALISFVDDKREWFKSRVGLEIAEVPREVSFGAQAILQEDWLVVEDTTRDERFAKNPIITSAPQPRFFAGIPLVTPDGFRIGA